ncbi:MAG: pyrroline-5-carboxylate reductase [Clostridia bacterium]
MRCKLGLIGTGAMAGAILERLLENLSFLHIKAEEIIAYDIASEKLLPFQKRGVTVAKSANEVFQNAEVVMLGIKPQFYADILGSTNTAGAKNIVSIMAGVTVAALRKYFAKEVGITRAMPNMPVQIGQGMTALYFDAVAQDTRIFIQKIFDSCGKTLVIDESKFDAVTSISGSGPAYVYLFASALIKGGQDGGLSYEESRLLALQTITGAAGLSAVQNTTDLDEMVDRVCSKGGTTIEAVEVLKARSLEDIVRNAVKACRDKSEHMSKEL